MSPTVLASGSDDRAEKMNHSCDANVRFVLLPILASKATTLGARMVIPGIRSLGTTNEYIRWRPMEENTWQWSEVLGKHTKKSSTRVQAYI